MKSEVESSIPLLQLRTCRKRSAFACLSLFFHWAFVFAGESTDTNLLGLTLLAVSGILVYPWKSLPLTRGMAVVAWVIMPIVLGTTLALTSHMHVEEAQGLLPLSLNLFCFTLVPVGFYRIMSPILLFTATHLALYLLNQAPFFSPFITAMLFLSNLIMSHLGWQISVWLQDVHRSRIDQTSLLGKAKLQTPKNSSSALVVASTKSRKGLILQFDLRGFSALVREVDENVYEDFMRAYYEIVSMAVGQNGGAIHRTTGDCHVVCFGVFGDKEKAPRVLLNKARNTFAFIVEKLAELCQQLNLKVPLNLGGALDYGEVRVRVFGHEDFHQDVDLVGSVLIRCARLEAHTKMIMSRRLIPRSMLISSSEALLYLEDQHNLDIISVRDQPVRDFAHLQWLVFQEFDSLPFDQPKAA